MLGDILRSAFWMIVIGAPFAFAEGLYRGWRIKRANQLAWRAFRAKSVGLNGSEGNAGRHQPGHIDGRGRIIDG